VLELNKNFTNNFLNYSSKKDFATLNRTQLALDIMSAVKIKWTK
jgi:hypothetical protein